MLMLINVGYNFCFFVGVGWGNYRWLSRPCVH